MHIGSNPAVTSISTADAVSVTVRGLDLADQLIGHCGFSAFYFLLVTGRHPNDAEQRLLDATLVAIAEHGMTPSVLAARMTLAAAPEALQGAVAAGIVGCGSKIWEPLRRRRSSCRPGWPPSVVIRPACPIRHCRKSIGFGRPACCCRASVIPCIGKATQGRGGCLLWPRSWELRACTVPMQGRWNRRPGKCSDARWC